MRTKVHALSASTCLPSALLTFQRKSRLTVPPLRKLPMPMRKSTSDTLLSTGSGAPSRPARRPHGPGDSDVKPRCVVPVPSSPTTSSLSMQSDSSRSSGAVVSRSTSSLSSSSAGSAAELSLAFHPLETIESGDDEDSPSPVKASAAAVLARNDSDEGIGAPLEPRDPHRLAKTASDGFVLARAIRHEDEFQGTLHFFLIFLRFIHVSTSSTVYCYHDVSLFPFRVCWPLSESIRASSPSEHSPAHNNSPRGNAALQSVASAPVVFPSEFGPAAHASSTSSSDVEDSPSSVTQRLREIDAQACAVRFPLTPVALFSLSRFLSSRASCLVI